MKRVFFTIIFLGTAGTAEAQEPGRRNELKFMTGLTAWLDEVTDYSATIGGAYRRYITPRLSIEPEFLYLIGAGSIRDITVIPNISYDFRPGRPIRPYLTAGVGWIHHSEKYPGALLPDFSFNDVTVSGGIGVRVFVTPRVFLAPEVRIGFEPIFRATGSFGFVF